MCTQLIRIFPGAFSIDKDAQSFFIRTTKTDQTARMCRLIWVIFWRTCQKIRFHTLRLKPPHHLSFKPPHRLKCLAGERTMYTQQVLAVIKSLVYAMRRPSLLWKLIANTRSVYIIVEADKRSLAPKSRLESRSKLCFISFAIFNLASR